MCYVGSVSLSMFDWFMNYLEHQLSLVYKILCQVPKVYADTFSSLCFCRCSELLESCRFSSFWPEFRKLGIPEYGSDPGTDVSEDRKLLANAVNGSKCSNTIRENMIRTLGKVYKTASLKTILQALDLKDEATLMSFASKIMIGSSEGEENETSIVEKVENGFVVFASCVENSKRAGSAFKEGVGYGDIAKMMMESKIRGQ